MDPCEDAREHEAAEVEVEKATARSDGDHGIDVLRGREDRRQPLARRVEEVPDEHLGDERRSQARAVVRTISFNRSAGRGS